MPFALTPWQTPLVLPHLTTEAVHLWRFPLVSQDSLGHLLNEQERQRAGRLRCPEKAQSFVVARARLRQVLANYLDLEPQSLRFTYGHNGKPALADLPEPPVFNLTHSGNWGLCAVAGQGEVGVDIETIEPGLDYVKLAERFFSAAEKQWLRGCPEWSRRRGFFRIWTRKEAWLKGKGGGFSDPDQDIGPAHLVGCCTCDDGWWLRSFPVARNTLAALAVSQEYSSIQRWNGWMD